MLLYSSIETPNGASDCSHAWQLFLTMLSAPRLLLSKINGGAGRDHWPGAMSILYAGGGLKMGQAIGSTNALAEYPTTKPYTPGCVLSTMYHVLGIDHHHSFYDHAQRPMPILSEGDPIPELIG